MKKLLSMLLLFTSLSAWSQTKDSASTYRLLLDENLQIDVSESMNQLYNFKFEEAESKFKEIMAKYPNHPLAYYLMGLSNWWKMMPYNEEDPRIKTYEPVFDNYMDLSIEKAEALYDLDENNLEASFFLCMTHGSIARHYAENSREVKSLNHTRKAFFYLKKLIGDEALNAEYIFGNAIFNYYAAWFKEEYPVLSPVLALFPKGDKALGLKQLKQSAYNSFWTRNESRYFLMRIYHIEEENNAEAFVHAEYLYKTCPDNSYFQRTYARICFEMGKWEEAKKVSESIVYKINIGMPGYEEVAGRYANYYLGRYFNLHGNIEKAKFHFEKAKAYSEKSGDIHQYYYISSLTELAKISNNEKNVPFARQYYESVVDNADKSNKEQQTLLLQAKEYLKKTEEKKKKGWLW